MMKRWLTALLMCIALCVCVCGALADNGPTLTLTSNTVEIGEMFEATVGEVEGADYYSVRLMRGEAQIYGTSVRTPGKIWLATTMAETANDYTIVADAMDEDGQLISSSAPQSAPSAASEAEARSANAS